MSFTERKAQMMNRTQLSYLFGLLNFEPTPQAFLVFRERCLCLRRVLRLRRAPPHLAILSFRRKISFLTSTVRYSPVLLQQASLSGLSGVSSRLLSSYLGCSQITGIKFAPLQASRPEVCDVPFQLMIRSCFPGFPTVHLLLLLWSGNFYHPI